MLLLKNCSDNSLKLLRLWSRYLEPISVNLLNSWNSGWRFSDSCLMLAIRRTLVKMLMGCFLHSSSLLIFRSFQRRRINTERLQFPTFAPWLCLAMQVSFLFLAPSRCWKQRTWSHLPTSSYFSCRALRTLKKNSLKPTLLTQKMHRAFMKLMKLNLDGRSGCSQTSQKWSFRSATPRVYWKRPMSCIWLRCTRSRRFSSRWPNSKIIWST